MEIKDQLYLVIPTVLALSMIIIPAQWAVFTKIIYSQKVAPRNSFIRAAGLMLLVVVWVLYY